ncbi:hypothetical protein [Martelella mediterranea]|uniref:Uncharacterized protein n=1 Tax=Martelella mediterranea TaxID=293089 RepID=A0A4R3P4N7_9HYPH|nr:hypothetical protein [Martelella mediterranea]TCT44472.1 hypothetical protein EDC90_100220 [Martelella mediterranea]
MSTEAKISEVRDVLITISKTGLDQKKTLEQNLGVTCQVHEIVSMAFDPENGHRSAIEELARRISFLAETQINILKEVEHQTATVKALRHDLKPIAEFLTKPGDQGG